MARGADIWKDSRTSLMSGQLLCSRYLKFRRERVEGGEGKGDAVWWEGSTRGERFAFTNAEWRGQQGCTALNRTAYREQCSPQRPPTRPPTCGSLPPRRGFPQTAACGAARRGPAAAPAAVQARGQARGGRDGSRRHRVGRRVWGHDIAVQAAHHAPIPTHHQCIPPPPHPPIRPTWLCLPAAMRWYPTFTSR